MKTQMSRNYDIDTQEGNDTKYLRCSADIIHHTKHGNGP